MESEVMGISSLHPGRVSRDKDMYAEAGVKCH